MFAMHVKTACLASNAGRHTGRAALASAVSGHTQIGLAAKILWAVHGGHRPAGLQIDPLKLVMSTSCFVVFCQINELRAQFVTQQSRQLLSCDVKEQFTGLVLCTMHCPLCPAFGAAAERKR